MDMEDVEEAEQKKKLAAENSIAESNWLKRWWNHWLQTHQVGLSIGSLIEVGAVTFDAKQTGEPPLGCEPRASNRIACTVVAADGQSSHAAAAWDDLYIRQGLIYTDTGFSGGITYGSLVTEPDGVRTDAEYRLINAGFYSVAYARVGITPKGFIPDLFLTASFGPVLNYGITSSQVGEFSYMSLSGRSEIDFSVVPIRVENLSSAIFFAGTYQRPLGVRILSGPDVSNFSPHSLSLGLGIRFLLTL